MKALLLIPFLAVAFVAPSYAHVAAEEMAAAANKFLESLTPEQRTKATFELKADERFNWHFIPKVRNGLTLKDMTPAQRTAAHALLRSGMGAHGYKKASDIMNLEAILKEIEGARGTMVRDSEL